MDSQAKTERTGVERNERGDLVIPGSRRADGTYRKPIRVKEGYIPPEELPVYETEQAKSLKGRPDIPGLTPGSEVKAVSKSAKKNLKRKEKKLEKTNPDLQKTDAPVSTGVSRSQGTATEVKRSQGTATEVKSSQQASESVSAEEAELIKQVKNLRKKLKQIDIIEQKIESGELAYPDPDQVKKVARRAEYLEAIDDLQFRLEAL